MKAYLVVLVAFDPYPVHLEKESIEFCSNVTKQIKVLLLGFQRLGARNRVNGRLTVKANGN